MNNTRLIRSGLVLLAVLTMSACDDPFQVIEELTFDESLGIVLSEFTRLESGVFIKDELVGTGEVTQEGQTAVLEYVGYLANGSTFGSGGFPFVIGSGNTIAGFELGVFGMRTGGQRWIIIPPSLGYGDSEQSTIPAGSVLIFNVELCSLNGTAVDPDCAG
jgi:hypothetical protein